MSSHRFRASKHTDEVDQHDATIQDAPGDVADRTSRATHETDESVKPTTNHRMNTTNHRMKTVNHRTKTANRDEATEAEHGSGSRQRTRDAATSEHEDERDSERTATLVCPECDGDVRSEGSETVCTECGLVIDTDEIDRGPEWRAFDSAERDEKSRVGAPTTNTMHDKGLSTNIGWQNRDGYGNALSSSQRQKMQRLRTWNERFRTRDSKERNLKQALGEIDRMASALGLPENVRETASVIYRQALKNDMLPGRSIEGIATASLHAAARMEGVPRSIDEVAHVSRVDAEEFKRAYRYINKELKLEIQPADPESYLPRFASDLGVPDETERLARQLLSEAKRANVHSGKSPVGLAAAALYAAGKLTNIALTQSEVSAVTDMSEVTIRNRYQELLEVQGSSMPGGAGENETEAAV